jgi:hypothetical protein
MMVSGKVPMIQYTPTQIQKERQMSEMNIPKAFEQPMMHQEPMFQDRGSKNQDDSTLEVEMVQSMAPLLNAPSGYVETAFKPVMENVHNASLA